MTYKNKGKLAKYVMNDLRGHIQFSGRAFNPNYVNHKTKIIDILKKENEMNKCEWKDGIFHNCSFGKLDFYGSLKIPEGVGVMNHLRSIGVSFCPFCGADIRKPEPEQPIIKKSGGTLVAKDAGVDWFCYENNESAIDRFDDGLFSGCKSIKNIANDSFGKWKPISEIEITDEIAKLRPMVIDSVDDICTVYGADMHGMLIVQNKNGTLEYKHPDSARLITVSDLEDS